jgi:hypothetical protein
MQHRRIEHRPPRTSIETWRFNRARGQSCPVCEAARHADLEEAEAVRIATEQAAIADVDRGRRFTETTDDLRRFTS